MRKSAKKQKPNGEHDNNMFHLHIQLDLIHLFHSIFQLKSPLVIRSNEHNVMDG